MTGNSTIETPRLRLVPFAPRHLTRRYLAWLINPDNLRYSEQRHRHHTLASCRRYLASLRGTPHCFWAIEARDPRLGHIGNLNAYLDPANGTADLGILLGEPGARGAGFALEAWVNVCAHLIEARGVRKVTAGMLAANAPMARLARRAGMRRDGRRRRQYLCEGRESDVVYAALFARDWPRVRRRLEMAGWLRADR